MANEYIRREDAIRLAEQGQVQGFPWQFQMLVRLPPADVVEVKHGEWISECEPHYECSECHHWFHLYQYMNYCPNCGAKMDAQRERSNMRTREDARIYKRLDAYNLEDGIGDLLEAIDEELDFEEEEDDFEEEE